MAEDTAGSVRRVVVELGAAEPASVLIDAAAELAEALNTQITGRFVEDETLLNVADLPTAIAISAGGRRDRLDRKRVAEAIALQESAYRRAFAARVGQGRLQWTFEVTRGRAVAVPDGIGPSDIVAVSASFSGLTLSSAFAPARRLLETAAAVLLVPERERNPRGPVAAVCEDIAVDIIEFAASLATRMGEQLSVLRVGEGNQPPLATDGRFRTKRLLEAGRLADRLTADLRALAPRLVVTRFPGGVFDDAGEAAALMRAARAPLLMIRPESGG
jgi:hypothetical protein